MKSVLSTTPAPGGSGVARATSASDRRTQRNRGALTATGARAPASRNGDRRTAGWQNKATARTVATPR
jgi:hypothetical protein